MEFLFLSYVIILISIKINNKIKGYAGEALFFKNVLSFILNVDAQIMEELEILERNDDESYEIKLQKSIAKQFGCWTSQVNVETRKHGTKLIFYSMCFIIFFFFHQCLFVI